MADIAAAADIAPRTFFAYFPSKEAVVFHDFDGLFESLEEAIEARPEGETAIDALRAGSSGRLPASTTRTTTRCCASACASTSRSSPPTSSTCCPSSRMILRVGVARDLGDRPDGLRPKLVAGGGGRRAGAIDNERHDKAQSMALLDETLDLPARRRRRAAAASV